MQVMAGLEMLAVVVLDDVGMSEGFQDLQFGGKLVLFFIRHARVGNFFAAEDLVVGLSAHLADDAK